MSFHGKVEPLLNDSPNKGHDYNLQMKRTNSMVPTGLGQYNFLPLKKASLSVTVKSWLVSELPLLEVPLYVIVTY